MKHHFADLLDREGDYWTVIPNMERFAFSLDQKIETPNEAKIVTISKDDKHWKQVFELPNIEELTLHEPNKEQVKAVSSINGIKRLRISHVRLNDIEFISAFDNLEECVFEYVSGFSNLTPFSELKKLKSLHFENLKRVSDFSGLSGLDNLKYLHIDGTIDWNQPIENLDFLKDLPNLEVLALGFVSVKSDYPAFLSVLHLNKLKRIRIGLGTLTTNEYAFLETALPNTICGAFGDSNNWELCQDLGNRIEFLGKRAGWINKDNKNANQRCQEFISKYESMKLEASEIIKDVANSK